MIVVFYILFSIIALYGIISLVPALVFFFKKNNQLYKGNNEFFSIVIPCRNEEKNIFNCLLSIQEQKFPCTAYEIIVVDDCSEDKTLQEIGKFCKQYPGPAVKIVKLKTNLRAKKGALTAGINAAEGTIIITRDADTVSVSENWLAALAGEFVNPGIVMVCAPAVQFSAQGFLEHFQLCENFLLQSIGAGFTILAFPFLSNGANLAFRKKTFAEVNGYEGNFDVASGDDIFLLQKIRKFNRRGIVFGTQPDAAVEIRPETSFANLLSQKTRWAGKFFRTLEPAGFLMAFCVFTMNLLFLILAAWSFVLGPWYKYLILGILIKWFIDFLLLILASSRFRAWSWLPWFIPLQVMNTVYSVIIPFKMLVSRPVWKGRKN